MITRQPSSAVLSPATRAAAVVRGVTLASIAFAASLACLPAAAQTSGVSAASHVPGRILILPRAGLTDNALSRILAEQGGGKARRIGKSELRIVELQAGREQAMVERLARHPHIKFAELDRVVSDSLASNDPLLGSQWHLNKIGANVAWDTAQGSGVTIAVVDSGVDSRHPDLVDRLVPGYNFVDGNTNTEDVKDHGTKVAGTAAAALNNGVGVASVAGQVKIMPVRVSNSAGSATLSAVASGITYAADRGARIANVSFGSVASSSSVLSAANYMKSKGGLVFVSAGNSNVDPGYANTSSIIIVAATNSSDLKASFSNFGDHVHLSAPGEAVYTTTWGQAYASVSGTSFSAPVAAGVAALVMSANPGLSNSQVESILFSTAKDLGTAGRDNYFGFGRVDAAAAVGAALAVVTPPADTQSPAASIAKPLGSETVTGLVPVDVTATDNVGVAKVELYVNGKLQATDAAAPYAFSWDTRSLANGMVNLESRAYDAAGNIGRSSVVSVNVANAVVVDITAPTVSITNPADGSTVPAGTVQISSTATDDKGAGGLVMTLSINGRQVSSSTGTGSISYGWNTRKLKSGSYTVSVSARDAAGNMTTRTATVRR